VECHFRTKSVAILHDNSIYMICTHSKLIFKTDLEVAGGGGEDAAVLDARKKRDEYYSSLQSKTEEVKATEEKEEEVIDETPLKIGSKQKEVVENKVEEKKEEPSTTLELTDDLVAEYLKKKTGRDDVSDLLKPVVDEKAEKARRKSESLSWGLQNKLIDADKLESFIKVNANPHQAVYEQQLEEARQEEGFDEDDFKSEYEEKFGLNEDKESAKYKRGQKLLNALAKNIIESTFPEIVSLESKYSSFEEEKSKEEKINKEVLSKAPTYKAIIEEVKTELKSLDLPIAGVDWTLKVDASEAIEGYIEHFSSESEARKQILGGATKEQISTIVKNAIIVENLPSILADAVNKGVIRHKGGLKGILKDRVSLSNATEVKSGIEKRNAYYSGEDN